MQQCIKFIQNGFLYIIIAHRYISVLLERKKMREGGREGEREREGGGGGGRERGVPGGQGGGRCIWEDLLI